MNRNRLLLVLFVVALLLLAGVLWWRDTYRPQAQLSEYTPGVVEEQSFQMVLQKGQRISEQSEFVARKGQVISFIIHSDQAGTLIFDNGDFQEARSIEVTPSNQFYLSSDRPGTYIITLNNVPLGTLIIQ